MHCLRRAALRFSSSKIPAASVPAPRLRFIATPHLVSSTRLPSYIPHRAALQIRFNSTSNGDAARPPPDTNDQEIDLDAERQEPSASNDENVTLGKRETRHENLYSVEKRTVYVGNLFFDLTAEDLRQQMEKYGVVTKTVIVYDNRGIGKGFGYVQYATHEGAQKAVDEQHMQILAGRPTVVHFAKNFKIGGKYGYPVSDTLYVGNIPFEYTDRDMQELFADVKNVLDVRVPVDRRTGMPRGFVHAEFLNSEYARRGMEVLERKEGHGGRKLKVMFAVNKRIGAMSSKNAEKQTKFQERMDARETEQALAESPEAAEAELEEMMKQKPRED